jgi:Zn-dependent peptidase ImmA (M78 family)
VDDLAQETGIPPAKLQLVLAGEPALTFNQLRKVADYCGRGVLFFLETGSVEPAQVYTPQFRTLNNQKVDLSPKIRKLIERVERQRDIYVDLLDELGGSGEQRFVPPKQPGNDILKSAAIARTWLDLDRQRTFSEYRIAVESKGILVFRSNGFAGPWQIPTDDPICGFTLAHPVCPVIFVKKQTADARQTFTLMHELGHLLLHETSFIDDDEDLYSRSGQEREANAFAGAALVPPSTLKKVDLAARPPTLGEYDEWLRPFRDELGVSTEALLRRLVDTKRLDRRHYEAYRKWSAARILPVREGGNRAYRYREPIHVFGDGFVRTVFDALHAKRISLSRASTYLDHLKIADIHQLEGTYATS